MPFSTAEALSQETFGAHLETRLDPVKPGLSTIFDRNTQPIARTGVETTDTLRDYGCK
jgi:hypothetical protein